MGKELEYKIDNILDEADGVDWHSNGEAYDYFDKYEAKLELVRLFKKEMLEFAEFCHYDKYKPIIGEKNGVVQNLWISKSAALTIEELFTEYFKQRV